jgi:hypothetical protein
MTLPLDAYNRRYLPAGKVAHLIPIDNAYHYALCGISVLGGRDYWLGTGSQDESDEAARRLLCRSCEKEASRRLRANHEIVHKVSR